MDLKLPHLGEGADSGTVVNLFVKEGDTITKGQPILELENEKAVATIPSTGAGTITRIFVKPGDKISVGHRILSLSDGSAGSAGTDDEDVNGIVHKRLSTPGRRRLAGDRRLDDRIRSGRE